MPADNGLQRRLDEAETRLLGAIDAARGAEAEKANALGLVRDLEYQVHMLQVEIDELRARLGSSRSGPARAFARRILSESRRLLAGPGRG